MSATVPAFKTELAFYNIAGVFFFATLGMALARVVNLLTSMWRQCNGKSALSADSQRKSYLSAKRPGWAPPPWLFGVVWTILYSFMGGAAYLVRTNGGACPDACIVDNRKALTLFWVLQGVLALYVLFSARGNFGLGALVVLASLVLAIITMVQFWPFDPWAGILMIPVAAWLLVALILSISMWVLNSESGVRAAAKAQSGAEKLRKSRADRIDAKV
jgi:translocator protein